jgi:hypothetical protein
MSSSPPLVWYLLLDSASGEPYKNTSVSSVVRSSLVVPVVDQFRKAVHLEYDKPKYLQDTPPSALLVYKNKATFDKRNAAVDEGKEEPLKSSCLLDGLGITEEDALIVVVPSPPLKHHVTLAQVLSQTLPSARMSRFPKSSTTTTAVHARDPCTLREWSIFDASVLAFIQSVETDNKKVERPVQEKDIFIRSEDTVMLGVSDNVVKYLKKIDRNFTFHIPVSSTDFLGRPDVGIVDDTINRLILVIELKCPWVIGNDLDLVNAKYKKTQHIIAQLNGYLSLNNMTYGVLSTYNHWWFFKRDTDNELFISKCYPHDSKSPTILQCMYFMIKLGRERPQELPITTREVKVYVENGRNKDVVFEERLHRGNYSDVWRITFRPEGKQGIFKLLDRKCGKKSSKKLFDGGVDSKKLIDDEVEVYEKLHSLQGVLIPNFLGTGWLGDVLYGFVTSYEGESLRGKLPTDSDIQEVKHILEELHKLGVAHGDIRLPNIVKNGDGKVKLIDFGLAKLSSSVQDRESDMEELERLKDGGRDQS